MVSLFGRKRDSRTMGGGYVSNATVTRLEDVAEQVCNELDRLRAENEALWSFVRLSDQEADICESCENCIGDDLWKPYIEIVDQLNEARTALRPYETGGDR